MSFKNRCCGGIVRKAKRKTKRIGLLLASMHDVIVIADGEGGKNTVEGRSKRGIVNECCDKMCEVRELVKYCAKAPSIR